MLFLCCVWFPAAKARLEGTTSSGTKQEVKPSTQSSEGEDEKPPAEQEKKEEQQEEQKKTTEETETKMEVISSSVPKGWQFNSKFVILV